MLKVEWFKQAEKELDKLDFKIAQRLVIKVNWLSHNFSHIIPEPLHGSLKGTYKLRVGDYKVVYTLNQDTIEILFVGHRLKYTTDNN